MDVLIRLSDDSLIDPWAWDGRGNLADRIRSAYPNAIAYFALFASYAEWMPLLPAE